MAANKGQALIELVLAIAIAVMLLAALTTGVIAAREGFARTGKIGEANILLQKEIEAIRSVRETAWNSISTPGIYHTEQSGNSWVAVSGTIIESGFTRGFTVANVCRSGSNSSIISCGSPQAVNDPSTKEIATNVSWSFLGTQSVSSTFYLTRYSGNQAWAQTTKAQFDQGNHQNTIATDISGGEVRIKSFISSTACRGSWQNPQVCKFDGTPASDQRGIFVSGNYAYVVGGDTAVPGTANDFFIYDISNPEIISLVGSTAFTARVVGYNVFVSGNYAYVTTSEDTRELAVIDVSTKTAPSVVGGYNITTGTGLLDGRGIYVVGTRAYLSRVNGTGADFFVLDISSPLSIPNPLAGGTIDLAGNGYDVFVTGNYAYIATSRDTRELDIINISNPSSISRVGQGYDIPSSGVDALGIFVVGTTAYLTTAVGATLDELQVLDVSNPSSGISRLGSRDLGGAGNDVFVDGNYAFIGTSNTSSEFQVVDISTPASPTPYGSTNLNGNTYGVYIVGDYAYLANTDDAAEFQVIKGGADTGIVGCRGDWQNPQVCQINGAPVADERSVFVSGDYAYMVGGDTATNADFFIYDISNPESISTPVGSLDLGAIGYNVFVSGNYAYVATSHDTRELTIVDVSNKAAPFISGPGYNITAGTGTQDGRGIYVVGNTAYLSRLSGTGADFFVLDVTTPSSPLLQGSIDLAGNGYDVFVLGNYAYIATSYNSRELDVINIASPTSITRAGWYNITENTDGLGIYVVGSTAYLTTTNGTSELYILDISTVQPNVPLLGSRDLGGAGNDVFVDGNYAFIGTSNASSEFQVIDITTPASPTPYGSTNLNGNTYGVYIVGDYAYLANTDNAAEFQVIKGGALYNGNFISSTFDAGSSVGFNYLTWTGAKPAGTNIRFQIATNNDGTTWKFVGPDGYTTTFYQIPGAVPLQKVAGLHLRYKFILSSNINGTSPAVEDVTVNYSP